MSNYIALLELYYNEGVTRRTQVNVRNATITDLQSARAAIKVSLERDGFEFSEAELESYYIVMLAKVDD